MAIKRCYQIVVISNRTGEILKLHKTDHIDCVKTHSIFYDDNKSKSYRIFDELQSIVIANKKVTLYYPNCFAEITQI